MLVYASPETAHDIRPCTLDAVDELCARSKQYPELVRFRDFHRAHPEVFDFLVLEARRVLRSGQKAFSFHTLFQVCRWNIYVEQGQRAYKLNDHLSPFFSRAIAILFPEFNGLAEFRGNGANGPNEAFGVTLEAEAHKDAARRCRRLVWADGTPLELGWRPRRPHVPVHAPPRRRDVH